MGKSATRGKGVHDLLPSKNGGSQGKDRAGRSWAAASSPPDDESRTVPPWDGVGDPVRGQVRGRWQLMQRPSHRLPARGRVLAARRSRVHRLLGEPGRGRQDAPRLAGQATPEGGRRRLARPAPLAPQRPAPRGPAHRPRTPPALGGGRPRVPVLGEVPHPLLLAVERAGVPGEQGPHSPAQREGTGPDASVGVSREQGAGVKGEGPVSAKVARRLTKSARSVPLRKINGPSIPRTTTWWRTRRISRRGWRGMSGTVAAVA